MEGLLRVVQGLLRIAQRAVELGGGAQEHGTPRQVLRQAVGGYGLQDVLLGLAGLAGCHKDAADAIQRGAHAVEVARFLVEPVAAVQGLGCLLVVARAEVGGPQETIDVALRAVVHHAHALRGPLAITDGGHVVGLAVVPFRHIIIYVHIDRIDVRAGGEPDGLLDVVNLIKVAEEVVGKAQARVFAFALGIFLGKRAYFTPPTFSACAHKGRAAKRQTSGRMMCFFLIMLNM